MTSYIYGPVRLPFEDTLCGSGGEWKLCDFLRRLNIEFEHCPCGVQLPPDFAITSPFLVEGKWERGRHLIEHKRTGYVLDVVNGRLNKQEHFAYTRLLDWSMFHPLAIVEDFSKWTWLVQGELLADQTTYLDKAIVAHYGIPMVVVRNATYKALDAYTVARRKAANDNQQNQEEAA